MTHTHTQQVTSGVQTYHFPRSEFSPELSHLCLHTCSDKPALFLLSGDSLPPSFAYFLYFSNIHITLGGSRNISRDNEHIIRTDENSSGNKKGLVINIFIITTYQMTEMKGVACADESTHKQHLVLQLWSVLASFSSLFRFQFSVSPSSCHTLLIKQACPTILSPNDGLIKLITSR